MKAGTFVYGVLVIIIAVTPVALALKWSTFLGNWVFMPVYPNVLDLLLLGLSGVGFVVLWSLERIRRVGSRGERPAGAEWVHQRELRRIRGGGEST